MVEFREVSPGEYFPPTLPNGRFFAQAAGGREAQEILAVTEDGLECGGVSFLWADITGFSIQGERACLLGGKYPSGGVKFTVGTCFFVGRDLQREQYLNGYPVEYCLMNGVVRRNPRNFRQPSSSPATSASRSMNLPSVWKV